MKIELGGLSPEELTERFRGCVVKNFGHGLAVERVVSQASRDGVDWRMRAVYSDGVERALFCPYDVELYALSIFEPNKKEPTP